ncbi:Gfo/Idh/MocA family oxidoreductase [Erwinia sp. MYb375]|uniref:Gfo/Idh/MocA family oxidoreductase n=1 Tax=Enterobacter agglomerans TaxID=549 RepID=A0ACC5RGR2_ENTAG|nr:Gfo/Idh/MocA family oxidoreductase [Pantoea agglomerans]MBK4723827.1 Gfo/Idh/MocA family oxidoreductase [Pantoea agglomerans]
MSALKVGIVGLGGIAQKAWLPVLTKTDGWQIAGAFSPNQEKARPVCDSYRIPLFRSLDDLAAASDAVFVHSTTASHYAIVDRLLRAGVDVCVDKPLAATLSEAERLVDLADKRGRKLMVAFNRRFAPRYLQLKSALVQPATIRMDKHRSDSVGPQDLFFTLLDDYLHVVDSALWLGGGEGKLLSGTLQTNDSGQMLYAEHHFNVAGVQVTTSMHRRAGSQMERVMAVDEGAVYQVSDMRDWQQEKAGQISIDPIPGWQTTLEQRGFVGAAHHFIRCVENQTMPQVSGEQALLAQRMVEKLWRDAERE